MKFYEVESSEGFFLVGTQDEAKKAAREHRCTWVMVEVPTDKEGLMNYINDQRQEAQCSQPQIVADEGNDEHVPVLQAESYTVRSVRLDDEIDKLPIGHALHLASLVIDRARSIVSEPSAEDLLS